MQVTFLEASQPLTKTFHCRSDGTITKQPYPMMGRFTSHTVEIHSLLDFFGALTTHAEAGHCLLKGTITRQLIDESRRGATSTNAHTQWMCLDFDRLEGAQVQDIMDTLGIGDVSYIVQYSASSGVFEEDEGTISAHVFLLLDQTIPAPNLKAWLMEQNIRHFDIRLSRTYSALSWPLDVTTCQNDKLIYIAPPKFIGMKDPFQGERIQFVKREVERLAVKRLSIKSMEAMKKEARAKLNELRKLAGLDALRGKTTVVGEYEVQNKPDECIVTGIRNDGEFVRLNLNGGDSWAYWHPVNNFELIHDFKTGMSYRTKELLPGYYQDLMREQDIARATPTKNGDLVLGFCDIPTAQYWKGLWNPERKDLRLWPAKNEKQLGDWYQSHGLTPPEFIPQWTIYFDPRSDEIVNEEAKTINLYRKSEYFDVEPDPNAQFPTIKHIIQHALNDQGEVYEHFINWFACIFQRKHKPLTAWVMHGDEGCVAGDTIINYARGNRLSGRPLTIKEAYEKFNGLWKATGRNGKGWNLSQKTRCRAVKDNMTVGFHEVMRIVQSGEQQLYKLTDEFGNSIRVTHEHPFMRPDGSFTKLCDLKPGDEIVRRGEKNAHARNKKGRSKNRATIYSIPFHPYGWRHVINGKNYKRLHKARLVFEAAMNHLSLEEFVDILRNDEARAKTLEYLDPSIVIHHIDEDPSNDALENLTTVDKLDHDKHHAKETGLGTVLCKTVRVKSIVKDKVEMTYDMTMKAPYHNYEANGFIVSNTGKGFFFNKIARPLLNPSNCYSALVNDLEEKFNSWMEGKSFILVDEVDVNDFKEKGRVTAKLRNYITEPRVSLRKMHAAAQEVDNWTAWLFSSNKKQPVFIPSGDRRYNVGRYQPKKLGKPDEDAVLAELEAFAKFLKAHPADTVLADSIIDTQDRRDIAALGVTSPQVTANAILEGDWEELMLMAPSDDLAPGLGEYALVYKQLIQRIKGDKHLTRDELFIIFEYTVGKVPSSPNKLTSYLKHYGINTKRIRKNGVSTYGIDVEWKKVK